MTSYRRRLEQGIHTAPTTSTTQGELATTGEAPEFTLKELQQQAEQLGLPTYGTKADLAQRIADNTP